MFIRKLKKKKGFITGIETGGDFLVSKYRINGTKTD